MSAIDLIDEVRRELAEIIWWNRNLTKITADIPDAEFDRSVIDLTHEFKGPFVEFILPSKNYEEPNRETWEDFADAYDYRSEVVTAVRRVLFNGRSGQRLYSHQGKCFKHLSPQQIRQNPADVIITAPTATGKTECFLIPIMNWIVTRIHELTSQTSTPRRTNSLRAIVIYPLKTLASDQMNRIVKYLYVANTELQAANLPPIRVGIWDGDTVPYIGTGQDFDFENYAITGESFRGMSCPKCGLDQRRDLDLEYASNASVKCSNRQCGAIFDWISPTRKGISRSPVDVLVTNPEALTHLLVNPRYRDVIVGNEVKFVVFDEAHVWTGVGGSSISVLANRIRQLFGSHEPLFILSSATISNPASFLTRLLQKQPSEQIRSIIFDPDLSLALPGIQPQFSEVGYARFSDLLCLIFYCSLFSDTADIENHVSSFLKDANFNEVMKTGLKLGLISYVGSDLLVTNEGLEVLNQWISPFINSTDPSPDFEQLASNLVDDGSFRQMWANLIRESLPELGYLLGKFAQTEVVTYAHFQELTERLVDDFNVSQSDAEKALETIFSLGRVANLVSDKYHLFFKPVTNIRYCTTCNNLILNEICRCGEPSYSLWLCRNCHEPAIAVVETLTNIQLKLLSNNSAVRCNCGVDLDENRFLRTFLHYNTFASFLASLVTRKLPENKLLMISDGRMAAEQIGLNTRDLDYRIVSNRVICTIAVLEKVIKIKELRRRTRSILFKIFRDNTSFHIYQEQLKNRSLPQSAKAVFEELDTRLVRRIMALGDPASSRKYPQLFRPALLFFLLSQDVGQNEAEKVVANELLREILRIYTPTFTNIPKWQRKKQAKQVGGDTFYVYPLDELADQVFHGWRRPEVNHSRRIELFKELASRLQLIVGLSHTHGGDTVSCDTESFWVPSQLDAVSSATLIEELEVSVPEKISYCENCYSGYPADLIECPRCGSNEIHFSSRFQYGPGGSFPVTGKGYIENRFHHIGRNWILDHWAKEIISPSLEIGNSYSDLDPASRGRKLVECFDQIVVGTHRSGHPQQVRSALERGFKDRPPKIQFLSTSPTMELGVDIGTLDAVGMVGLPPIKASYVQRSGRAGRKMQNRSFILVLIRNENAIDGHYFADIQTRYLNRSIWDIHVPDPPIGILKGHLLTEILVFFVRSYVQEIKGIFHIFSPSEIKDLSQESEEEIALKLSSVVAVLMKLVGQHLDELSNHLRIALPMLEQPRSHLIFMFRNDGSGVPHLWKIFIAYVERFLALQRSEGDENSRAEFMKMNSTLALLLSKLELFSDFRGIRREVPLFIKHKKPKLEMLDIDQALREAFPGPVRKIKGSQEIETSLGAIHSYQAEQFDLRKVGVSKEPIVDEELRICTNGDCYLPYHAYSKDIIACPLCRRKTSLMSIYEYRWGLAGDHHSSLKETRALTSRFIL